jgi:hypothetical protein
MVSSGSGALRPHRFQVSGWIENSKGLMDLSARRWFKICADPVPKLTVVCPSYFRA